MSDSMGMRWYIVHTMSNYEKRAGEAIIRIERALQLKRTISIKLLRTMK